jgi:preprotein translocase subunit SecD
MPYRISAFLMMVFFAFAPASFAGGKADKKGNLSFHVETEESDHPKMIFPYELEGKKKFFRRVPDITSNDIVAFGSFPSDDGQSYGVAFRLKDNARNRLAAITTENQGKWLIAQVNGRIVDAVLIDKPVSDGFIIIWKGITLEEINQYDKVVPRINGEKPKKK